MARAENQALESKAVNKTDSRLETGKEEAWQNEGITLCFIENKGDKKMTSRKFASTPKCSTKISHLSLAGLNVIENK